jgi:hypothetical protein
LRFTISTVLILLSATLAFAHPVSFQGATGLMTWNQTFMSDNWITYSFRSDMAFAARLMRMEMPDGRMNYSGAQFDYLLKRWNGEDYQANIYVFGGGGVATVKGTDRDALLVGFEADAESRKYFTLVKAETMQSAFENDFNHVEARVGIAPYEAQYTELATWFMIQTQWHPTLQKKFVLTPLARLFYKSFMLESGVSVDGDWMMNFMFHF